MQPRVNKWLDLLDRAGWTAVQAAAGAALVYITDTAVLDWEAFAVFVGGAVGIAVLKVVVGQNTGDDESGALVGKPVIEPPPE
jgi:hypothetical protein